ncbi:MAG: hypothetical protein V4549_06480 [Bacteroidota bacterium]
METKKSKVTKIDFQKEWAGAKGTVYYFLIEFANGDKGQFSANKKDQTKFKVEAEEEYTLEIKINGEYKNTIINKPVQEGKGGFQKNFSPKGNESFALAYAKDVMIATWGANRSPDAPKAFTSDQMFAIADKMFTWLESKKK